MKITRNTLFRRVVILSLAVLVFWTSFIGSYANTAHAVGADTVIKLVGGKAVVRSLAEKAGMALSPKQLNNAVDLIEKKTYDGDTRYIDWVNKANNMTPSSTPSAKSGFKKYVLDPAMWLTGLDIIFDVVEAFQDGYDNGTTINLYTQCLNYPSIVSDADKAIYPYYMEYVRKSDGATFFVMWKNSGGYVGTSGSNYYLYNHGGYKLYSRPATGSYGSSTTSTNTLTIGDTSNYTYVLSTDQSVCAKPVTADDVINITNVNNTVHNHFDNDTYNTNTTYNMEIEYPDSPDYNSTEIWNDIDYNIVNEVESAPPPAPKPDSDGDGIADDEDDSDSDGVTDDKDSNADGDGFLENLLGIVALIAVFDLLKAVIFYLARMFEFILTIPLIEAVPIDNEAFAWFRTAEIVGIEIYSVVSLLATIGLSFAVYKVVRRLLP